MADGVTFEHRFNPTMGIIHSSEQEQRDEICLNGKWEFMPIHTSKKEDFKLPNSFEWSSVPIKIPSPWNVNDYTTSFSGKNVGGDFTAYPSYPAAWDSANIGWMRKVVTLPDSWDGTEIKLHFKGVMGNSMVYVNGVKVGENFDLFLPFEYDVTDILKKGENEILVGVARASLYNIPGKYGNRPYVGGSSFAKHAAGIWQDVFLLSTPKVHISDLFIKPRVSENRLEVVVNVTNSSDKRATFSLSGEIYEWINLAGKGVIEAPVAKSKLAESAALSLKKMEKLSIGANESATYTFSVEVGDALKYWTPETPNLYGAVLKLNGKSECIDTKYQRFGWREFKIKGTEVQLNGKKIVFKGDSWHFTGTAQLTRRYAWAWCTMLKEANANTFRPHAQVYPDFYMDVADEMGICVLSETAIWSSDGGPKIDSEEYWSRCNDHVERLIARDKNHPSIFGWSVCNEVIPVAMHLYKAPKELVERQTQEVNNWSALALKLDDTREWTSGDGETQVPLELPTVIGHYGDSSSVKNWSSKGKPWGIGETSKAYFGTPMQISETNGERSFESVEGRMEALAEECHALLREQDKFGASYQSVFNIVWYALQPLNLGKSDKSTAPKLSEGIFMTHSEEGVPGMQPERIGPYCNTLNPGYDPSLPLYKPWPMFYAIKDANAGIDTFTLKSGEEGRQLGDNNSTITAISSICIIGDVKKWSGELLALGAKSKISSKINSKSLVVIDAETLSKSDVAAVKRALAQSAKIYISTPTPSLAKELNEILPAKFSLLPYSSNSLIVNANDAMTLGLSNRTLYFSELLPMKGSVLKYALSHSTESDWTPLVVTCKANWQNWNYRGEPIKTAMVYRTEYEREVELPVISKYAGDDATIYINTADWYEVPIASSILPKRILQNLGVQFSSAAAKSAKVVDKSGFITSALHTSVMLDQRYGPEIKAFRFEHLKDEPNLRASLNSTNGAWSVMNSKDGELIIAEGNTAKVPTMHYLGFWIYSPRALDDLLIEPNIPTMDLISTLPNAFAYINGKEVQVNKNPEGTTIKNLQFVKGWNYILLKFIQPAKSFERFKIELRSDREDYQSGLDGLLEK